MLVHKSRFSAYSVYLLFSGATSLSFSIIFTVNMVYQVEVARLNPLQLVLVGTVLESATSEPHFPFERRWWLPALYSHLCCCFMPMPLARVWRN